MTRVCTSQNTSEFQLPKSRERILINDWCFYGIMFLLTVTGVIKNPEDANYPVGGVGNFNDPADGDPRFDAVERLHTEGSTFTAEECLLIAEGLTDRLDQLSNIEVFKAANAIHDVFTPIDSAADVPLFRDVLRQFAGFCRRGADEGGMTQVQKSHADRRRCLPALVPVLIELDPDRLLEHSYYYRVNPPIPLAEAEPGVKTTPYLRFYMHVSLERGETIIMNNLLNGGVMDLLEAAGVIDKDRINPEFPERPLGMEKLSEEELGKSEEGRGYLRDEYAVSSRRPAGPKIARCKFHSQDNHFWIITKSECLVGAHAIRSALEEMDDNELKEALDPKAHYHNLDLHIDRWRAALTTIGEFFARAADEGGFRVFGSFTEGDPTQWHDMWDGLERDDVYPVLVEPGRIGPPVATF